MRIGFDFDKVVADPAPLKIELAKKLFGVKLTPGQAHAKVIFREDLLTKEQYRIIQDIIHYDWKWGLRLKEMEGALKYISKLLKRNHHLLTVTSRGENRPGLAIAREWYRRRKVAVDIVGVGYALSKKPAIKKARLRVYMDNDLHKLEKVKGVVPHLFLFSPEYGEEAERAEQEKIAKRVGSWKEFYEEVIRLESAR